MVGGSSRGWWVKAVRPPGLHSPLTTHHREGGSHLGHDGAARTAGGDGKAAKGGAAGFTLSYDAWGQLVLTDAAGRQHVGVRPVRAFPISDPAGGLAICDADGRELIWVESLDGLPEAQRQLLEEDLARRQLMPVILRIVTISAPAEPSEWEVETDRGLTRFV